MPAIWVIFICFLSINLQGNTDFESWIVHQKKVSYEYLYKNISPDGALPGVVVASPSKDNPDYFYHWVRDAALVMGLIMDDLETLSLNDWHSHPNYLRLLNYSKLARENQKNYAITGLGEPKFHVNGQSYQGPWGRPQNDGPALRALVMIRFSHWLLDRGQEILVKEFLYRKELPARTLVKADLEYVSHHWKDTCFDLWEEVKGHHFYTRLVQLEALKKGADLAERLKDGGAAKWYLQQAASLEKELWSHWKQGIVVTTLNRDGGLDYKHSNLDTSVLLAILHTKRYDLLKDEGISTTLQKITSAFQNIYKINQAGHPATLLGRYPEDQYYGGNPWVLTTAAVAQYYYLIGDKKAGDQYLKRLRFHTPPSGRLAEQLDRHTGFMKAAPDLTWSYAAMITAIKSRSLTPREP